MFLKSELQATVLAPGQALADVTIVRTIQLYHYIFCITIIIPCHLMSLYRDVDAT
jgi:hypothetical protein